MATKGFDCVMIPGADPTTAGCTTTTRCSRLERFKSFCIIKTRNAICRALNTISSPVRFEKKI
jgi:hypothetical protein